ncbi:MAG: CotH kinase family protein [Acidobacteria bacterium]|nr:CotH kinase family protein [Acidobacteriota bacterium]
MRTVVTVRVGVACGVLLLAVPAPVPAQTADDLFDARALQEIRVFVNERDLHQLRTRYTENTYYPADIHWGDVRVRNAGIRSRGKGSRNGVKLGLHIDFDHYVARQRFLGLTSIDLDNLWQDPSMLREYTAMALFVRMGQPAPRESFARVYINGAYQGVYAIVETVNTSFLMRTLGRDDGFLFEYHWIDRYEFTDLGSDLAALEARFERRTQGSAARSAAYAPMAEMIRAINALPDDQWRSGVEPYVDLRQFLTHVAIEQFLSELDGLTGYEGLNNFYVYRGHGSTRHQFLPWDRDNAFQDAQSSVFHRADRNVLLRRALAFDDLRAFYLGVLERCATVAASDRWLERVIAAAAAVIADAAGKDPLKPYDAGARDAAVRHLVEFGRVRPAVVHGAVTDARAAQARRRN